MEAVVSFGLWNLIAPLFLWVPLFALVTGLVGLSTVRRGRRWLIAAGRKTRLTTALVGIFLLVLLPLAAGFFGGTFAFKRGLANVVDKGGERVVSWSVSSGAASLRAAIGVQDGGEKLPTRKLRAYLGTQLAGSAHTAQLRAGDPLAAVWRLPQLLERAFFSASDSTLAAAGDELSWDELVVKTQLTLKSSFLAPVAAQLRAAAIADLLFLLGIVVLSHGLSLAIVWLLARRRLTVEA
jgi:hypothetical protein